MNVECRNPIELELSPEGENLVCSFPP